MTEKNPYENQETVDIPDFQSIKSDDEDIDSSAFKAVEDFDDEEDEEYYEKEPKYRRVKEPVIIAALIALAALLVLSIFGIAFGVSKKNAYNELKEEYDAYVSKATANETSLNAQIQNLQAQIAQQNNNSSNNEGTKDGAGEYNVVADAINVRSEANTSAGVIGSLEKGDVVKVVETVKDNSGNVWGKLDDFFGQTGYFCIKNGNDALAELK